MSDDQIAFKKSVDDATLKILTELLRNVEKAAIILESEVKKECPIDQGILRASITHEAKFEKDGIVGIIASPMEIAPYVHQGTGLYAMDGNGRKTPWKYKAVAGKYKGWHTTKGQKPNPFMDRAKIKAKDRVEKALGGK